MQNHINKYCVLLLLGLFGSPTMADSFSKVRLDTGWVAQRPVARQAPRRAIIRRADKPAPIKVVKISPRRRQASSDAKRAVDSRLSPREAYVSRALVLANELGPRYGIPPVAIVAMSALESGYGRSYLATHHHAYFGIKADGRWEGPRGYRGGCVYRSYGSMRESFVDYCEFLKYSRRYRAAFRETTAVGFVRVVLRSGYCPTPGYLTYVRRIIEEYCSG